MTGIIDYGMGNLRSVQKAFEYLGEKAVISSDKKVLDDCERLILPGVGSFGQGMSQLTALSLGNYVKKRSTDTPVLGICLGMQFLMSRSFEDGENAGLGFCRGDVVKFAVGKVPQIGWNGVFSLRSPLFDGIRENEEFYFVHSYYAAASEGETIAFCEYGVKYSAAVWNGKNVYGVQFHPEKSGNSGLKLLKNFLTIKGA
jgi:glutamine amidotransferase